MIDASEFDGISVKGSASVLQLKETEALSECKGLFLLSVKAGGHLQGVQIWMLVVPEKWSLDGNLYVYTLFAVGFYQGRKGGSLDYGSVGCGYCELDIAPLFCVAVIFQMNGSFDNAFFSHQQCYKILHLT